MTQKESCKICLVGECLSDGGAEKTMALLSHFFDSKGIEVHHVIVIDSVAYPYSGELLNLGKLKNPSNGLSNKLKRFLALRKFLRQHDFDYIIDFRVRPSFLQELLTNRLLYNAPVIYTVHSSILDLYFPGSRWESRLIYKDAAGIVAVSDTVAQLVSQRFGLDNVTAIHNPIDPAIMESNEFEVQTESAFIIAAGSMKMDVKQFDKLIAAYAASELPAKNIKLMILGEGPKRKQIEAHSASLGMESHVVFKGFVDNPYDYMKRALFFVLSSKREGFPMVVLESLACGIPVVAFDCVSGPGEMIADRENGLLVADQNFPELVEAMNLMANDKELYQHCKRNAAKSVAKFSLETTGNKWLDYLKIRKLAV